MTTIDDHQVYCERLAGAAIAFTDVWSDSWLLSGDGMGIAGRINQVECEALADILGACGHTESRDLLLTEWIAEEIRDRECEEGDYIVVEGVLIDTREATFTCDGCQRTGNIEDGCVHGDPCPDEECTGTVSVVVDGS